MSDNWMIEGGQHTGAAGGHKKIKNQIAKIKDVEPLCGDIF
jgi:hypothetical protein